MISLLCKGGKQQQQQEQPQLESSVGANGTAVKEKETPPEEAVEGNAGDGNNGSPGGEGSNTSPGFLSDEDVATLGAPSGGNVDPAMTAVFKVFTVNSENSTTAVYAYRPTFYSREPCTSAVWSKRD